MKWLLKRLGRTIGVIFTVVTLTFALIHALPGGPMEFIKAQLLAGQQGKRVSPERIQTLAESYLNVNPSEPLYIQYIDYITSIAQADLGQSVWYGAPVANILADAIPWTLFLMGTSLLISYSLGIVGGAILAYNEGGRFDQLASVGATLLNSIPFYLVAIFFVYIFAYQFNLFPPRGRVASSIEPGFTAAYLGSVLHHAVLPLLSVVLTEFGGVLLQMRGNSIQVIGEDYVRVGRLRGLSGNRLSTQYVARNAILPMYTSLMISIGFMFGGSIILERVFSYPGVGYYMFKAINSRDYPLMMGAFLLITTAVIVGILVAELTYSRIDPRITSAEAQRPE